MKKKKLLKYAGYLLPFFAILLFVIATFVFFGNKKQVEKYTVDISFYDNLSEVALFEDEIENKLKINFEDLHLKNGGEIILDDSGNIKDLTIDFYYKRNNTIYGGQIEKDDNNYCLIVEPLSLTEIEENPLSNYLSMLSFWNDDSISDEVKIEFANEHINGIKVNSNLQKYLFDGKEIVKVESSKDGLFVKATILLSDNSFEELYFQVK